MDNLKIVFIGPVGAGKTSAIQAVSEITPIDTEAKVSEGEVITKETTTVAIDYGRVTTAAGQKVHMYGAPGQIRFEFMWDMLKQDIANDCSGVVVMIDNTADTPKADLLYYLEAFKSLVSSAKLLVLTTQTDLSPSPAPQEYEAVLTAAGVSGTVIAADARDTAQIKQCLATLVGPLA